MEKKVVQLRVASDSPFDKVGSAAIRFLNEGNEVEFISIGAGAVNQAVKALIRMRVFASSQGLDLAFIPGFVDAKVGEAIKSAVTFKVVKV